MTKCLGAAAVEKETIDTQKVTKYRSRKEGGRKDTQKPECLSAAEVEKAIDTQKEKLSRLSRKGLQREVCLTQRAGSSLDELRVYG